MSPPYGKFRECARWTSSSMRGAALLSPGHSVIRECDRLPEPGASGKGSRESFRLMAVCFKIPRVGFIFMIRCEPPVLIPCAGPSGQE